MHFIFENPILVSKKRLKKTCVSYVLVQQYIRITSIYMATTTLDQVLAHIQQAHPIPGGNSRPVSYKHAAVLIPLYEANPGGEVRVLLTQRSKTLRSHPGETCFPGGKRDDEDIDDISTAVREIREELGIQADEIRVVAVLPPVLSKHLYSVTPVVARLVNPIHEIAVEPNSEEVDHVFSAPLGMFLSHTWPDARYSFRDGTWDDIKYRMHVWEYRWTGDTLPSRDANNEVLTFVIWGLTAALCVDVAILGYQRSPSFCCLPDESYSMLHDVEYVDGKVRRRRRRRTSSHGR